MLICPSILPLIVYMCLQGVLPGVLEKGTTDIDWPVRLPLSPGMEVSGLRIEVRFWTCIRCLQVLYSDLPDHRIWPCTCPCYVAYYGTAGHRRTGGQGRSLGCSYCSCVMVYAQLRRRCIHRYAVLARILACSFCGARQCCIGVWAWVCTQVMCCACSVQCTCMHRGREVGVYACLCLPAILMLVVKAYYSLFILTIFG